MHEASALKCKRQHVNIHNFPPMVERIIPFSTKKKQENNLKKTIAKIGLKLWA